METRLDSFGDPLPPHALARLGTLRWQHSAEPITALAFSTDASTVFAKGIGVSAFDTRNGAVRWHYDCAAQSGDLLRGADGDTILTVSVGGTAHVFDALTGTLRRNEKVSTEYLATLLAAPNGACLFLGGVERYAALTEPDFTVRTTLPLGGPTPKATFSPDGTHLALYDSTGVLSVFRTDGTLVRELVRTAYYTSSLCLLDGGTRLLVGQGTGVVDLYDVTTGTLESTLQTGPYTLLQVVATRDARYAYTASYAHIARWNLSTLTREALHPLPTGATRLCLSPDESTLAYAVGARVVLLDAVTLTERAPLDAPKLGPLSLRYTAKGDTLVSLSIDRQVRWWSLSDATSRHAVTLDSDAAALVSAKSPTHLLVTPSGTAGHLTVDLEGGTTAVRDDLAANVSQFWEGRTVRAAIHSGSLHLTNADGATHAIPGGANGLVFSSDDQRVVYLAYDTLQVWDMASLQPIVTCKVKRAKGFALSPTGDEAAVWTSSSLHRVSLATGKAKAAVKPELLQSMPLAAYSPDGERLAFVNAGDVVLIDAKGTELARFATGARELTALAFRPDGKELAVGARDSTITRWDIDDAIARTAPAAKPTKAKKPKA